MNDTQDIMLGLGDFIFAISTVAYNQLQRTDEWRWAEQARFLKNDALQVTGRPNPIITITGKANALFMDGASIGIISELRQLGNTGKPQQLVLGTGKVMGYWVMTGLDETQTSFFMGGTPKAQEFTLRLKYYGSSL